MFTNDRNAYRNAFFIAWEKHAKKIPLEPVEAQIIEIILLHPEYHRFLEKPDQNHSQEFALEENPFLHMSLHIAIREQLHMNRPAGITTLYQQLLERFASNHDAEHWMMTRLAQVMWQSQQNGEMPSEEKYLQLLRE